jgi:hypothetical protein
MYIIYDVFGTDINTDNWKSLDHSEATVGTKGLHSRILFSDNVTHRRYEGKKESFRSDICHL